MENIDYDSIPVFYCRRCRSLDIRTDPEVGDFCNKCGSTEIGSMLIEQYLRLTGQHTKIFGDKKKHF